jgi:hypothetical protein
MDALHKKCLETYLMSLQILQSLAARVLPKKKIVTTILNVIEAFLKHLLPSRTLVVIPGNLSLNKCSSSVVYLLSFIFTSVTTRTSFAT